MSKRQTGMTLIEVLITLTIAGTILAYGVPNLRDFFLKQSLNDQANNMLGDLSLTRAESITRGIAVRLSGIDGDLANGWEIVTDRNRNGFVDGDDEVIRRTNSINSSLEIDDAEFGNAILFSPIGGLVSATSRVIKLKHEDIITFKTLTITLSGRANVF